MKSTKFECKICAHPYDEDHHAPRIIPIYGHTLCTACIRKLTPYLSFECPFDMKKMHLKHRDLREFPKNYALMDEVELNKPEKCAKHGKNLEFVCKTDMAKLCYQCLYLEKHHEHEIVEKSEFKQQVGEKYSKILKYKEQMEAIVEKELKDFSSSVASQKPAVFEAVDKGIQECIEILNLHKERIIKEIYDKLGKTEEEEKLLVSNRITNDAKESFKDTLSNISDALQKYQDEQNVENSIRLLELSSKLCPISQWKPKHNSNCNGSLGQWVKIYFQQVQKGIKALISGLSIDKIQENQKNLFVTTPTGQTYTIQYYDNPTIKELSELISTVKRVDYPFILFCNGKFLTIENLSLADYGIGPNSTLEIKPKPDVQQSNKSVGYLI